MKYILLLASFGLLAGCATETPEQLAAADDATCTSYGAPPGSPNYTQCRLQVAGQRDELNRQRMIAFGAAMRNAGQTMQQANQAPPPQLYVPRPPTTTNCMRTGNMVNCTTF